MMDSPPSKKPKQISEFGSRPGPPASASASPAAVSPPLIPGADKAMLNNLVLATVSECLPAAPLLLLRTACTAWNAAFKPGLQKKHSPIVLNQCWGYPTPVPTRNPIAGYTELMRSSAQIPFTRYEIYDPTANAEELQDFFSVCGSSVKSLRLVTNFTLDPAGQPVDWNLDLIRKVIFQWTPKLQVLELEVDLRGGKVVWDEDKAHQAPPLALGLPELKRLHFRGSWANHGLRTLLEDLVRCAVHLKCLTLPTIYNRTYTPVAPSILRQLGTGPGTLSKLKALHLGGLSLDQARDELQLLIQLGSQDGGGGDALRLDVLKIKYIRTVTHARHPNFEGPRLLHSFLVTQAPTLRRFHLTIFGSRRKFSTPTLNLRIPHMPALHSLRLQRYGVSQLELSGGTLAATFPRLEEYAYNNFSEDGSTTLADANYGADIRLGGHPGVTWLALHVHTDGAAEYEALLTTFRSFFPSVTRLEISVRARDAAELLGPVWRVWPGVTSLWAQLREDIDLYAQRTVDLDELVTGVPKDGFQALRREFQEIGGGLQLDILRTILTKYKTRGGIADLHKLQKLVICMPNWYKYSLTNIGGYFGFAMASPTLRWLTIEASNVWHMKPKRATAPPPGDENQEGAISAECDSLIMSLLAPYAWIDL